METQSVAIPMLDSATVAHKEVPKPNANNDRAVKIEHPVRVVSPAEYREAAACLAEAFADDHVVRYQIDTPDRAHWPAAKKWKLHLAAMEYITYAHCLKGLVLTTGPNYDCVALWMPPGKNMDDVLTIFRSGLWRLKFRLSAQGRQRFFSEFLPLLHKTKAAVLGARDEESWYLVYIGTKTASRGRGYCRKLVEHVTRQADVEARACYLESSLDINRVIYGRLGFQTIKQIHLKEDEGSIMDIMVREPIGKSLGHRL